MNTVFAYTSFLPVGGVTCASPPIVSYPIGGLVLAAAGLGGATMLRIRSGSTGRAAVITVHVQTKFHIRVHWELINYISASTGVSTGN